MMRYITDGRPWNDDQVDELLERQQRSLDAHGVCFGAVQRLDDARLVGLAGMQKLDTGDFELGWWIWKDHWGRGYAPEAIAPYISAQQRVDSGRRENRHAFRAQHERA